MAPDTAWHCAQVVVATGSTLVVADADAAADQAVSAGPLGPVLRLAVSPNGHFLALYAADGRLTVWAADLTKSLSEFATQAEEPPQQLAWCGTDSVVLLWEVRPSSFIDDQQHRISGCSTAILAVRGSSEG